MNDDTEARSNALVAANVLAAMRKAQAEPAEAVPAFLLRKGDVPGHEFHGNQYSEAAASAHEAAASAHEAAAVGSLSSSAAAKATADANKASEKTSPGSAYIKRPDGLREANKETAAGKASYAAYQARSSEKSRDSARGPQAAQSAGRSRAKYHEEAAAHHREQAAIHRGSQKAASSTLRKVHNKSTGEWRVEDDDGHVYGKFDSEAAADKQLAALYAAKEDESKKVEKGDVAGHEFHGNQYAGGSVGASEAAVAAANQARVAGSTASEAHSMSHAANQATKEGLRTATDLHSRASELHHTASASLPAGEQKSAHLRAFSAHLAAARGESIPERRTRLFGAQQYENSRLASRGVKG